MHVALEEYEVDNVTITVKWTQQVIGATYSAGVSPLGLVRTLNTQ